MALRSSFKLLESTQGTRAWFSQRKRIRLQKSVINAFKSVKNQHPCARVHQRGPMARIFGASSVNGKSGSQQCSARLKRANSEPIFIKEAAPSLIKITAEERKLAIKATKTLNLAVAGVGHHTLQQRAFAARSEFIPRIGGHRKSNRRRHRPDHDPSH